MAHCLLEEDFNHYTAMLILKINILHYAGFLAKMLNICLLKIPSFHTQECGQLQRHMCVCADKGYNKHIKHSRSSLTSCSQPLVWRK